MFRTLSYTHRWANSDDSITCIAHEQYMTSQCRHMWWSVGFGGCVAHIKLSPLSLLPVYLELGRPESSSAPTPVAERLYYILFV